jgi:putative hydrolase of the HAD superfamily
LDDADPRSRGLLLDLFGTLVFFDAARLPRVRIRDTDYPLTIDGADELLARLRPPPSFERLFDAIRRASADISRETEPSLVELPTRERFRRALALLETGGDVEGLADELSRRHMQGLSRAVVCPPDRVGLLDALRATHRLALVSNFDHGPTAHDLLRRDRLRSRFDAIVISEEVGLRKPHPDLFLLACERLGLPPDRCVHVGDSHRADVVGATSVGMQAVWIDSSDAPMTPACARLRDVTELPAWLAGRAP